MMGIHFNKVLNEEKYKSYSQSCIESSIRECIIRVGIISCCGNQGSSHIVHLYSSLGMLLSVGAHFQQC